MSSFNVEKNGESIIATKIIIILKNIIKILNYIELY